jgi:hypothetical protein
MYHHKSTEKTEKSSQRLTNRASAVPIFSDERAAEKSCAGNRKSRAGGLDLVPVPVIARRLR